VVESNDGSGHRQVGVSWLWGRSFPGGVKGEACWDQLVRQAARSGRVMGSVGSGRNATGAVGAAGAGGDHSASERGSAGPAGLPPADDRYNRLVRVRAWRGAPAGGRLMDAAGAGVATWAVPDADVNTSSDRAPPLGTSSRRCVGAAAQEFSSSTAVYTPLGRVTVVRTMPSSTAWLRVVPSPTRQLQLDLGPARLRVDKMPHGLTGAVGTLMG